MCIRVSRTITITEELVRKYTLLSGDNNPIHEDSYEAKLQQFDRPIAHGMLVMGFGAQIAAALSKKGILVTEYEMNFLKPVFIGDEIQLVVKDSDDFRNVEIEGFVGRTKVTKGKFKYVK